MISLFEMTLNCSAKVLSNIPKHRKAVVCFSEKIGMLPKPYSGSNYSEVDNEFSVNENPNTLKKVSLNRKKKKNHIKQGYILTSW